MLDRCGPWGSCLISIVCLQVYLNWTHDELLKLLLFVYETEFKRNYISKPLYNTELYQLMCNVLGVIPNTNNGTWSNVAPLLLHPGTAAHHSMTDELWFSSSVCDNYAKSCSRFQWTQNKYIANTISLFWQWTNITRIELRLNILHKTI